jgi:hypothetical protein
MDRAVTVPHTVEGALVALRDTLEHESPIELGRVADPLRILCVRARDEGVTPERLLVRLKETLDGVPGLGRRAPDGFEAGARERIVSYAIAEYFSPVGRQR